MVDIKDIPKMHIARIDSAIAIIEIDQGHYRVRIDDLVRFWLRQDLTQSNDQKLGELIRKKYQE